jgi:hypothetical protein
MFNKKYNFWGPHLSQPEVLLACDCEGNIYTPGQFLLDLWRTKWHRGRIFFQIILFSPNSTILSVAPE